MYIKIKINGEMEDRYIDGEKWRILTSRSGLAERYNVALCILPLDLAFGAGFAIDS